MNIFFHPQVSNNTTEYTFETNKITVKIIYNSKEYTDAFDFSEFPDGELSIYDEDGNNTIETELPVNILLGAKRVDGILTVELLHWIDIHEEREHILFPEEIEHTEYEEWLTRGLEEANTDGEDGLEGQ